MRGGSGGERGESAQLEGAANRSSHKKRWKLPALSAMRHAEAQVPARQCVHAARTHHPLRLLPRPCPLYPAWGPRRSCCRGSRLHIPPHASGATRQQQVARRAPLPLWGVQTHAVLPCRSVPSLEARGGGPRRCCTATLLLLVVARSKGPNSDEWPRCEDLFSLVSLRGVLKARRLWKKILFTSFRRHFSLVIYIGLRSRSVHIQAGQARGQALRTRHRG